MNPISLYTSGRRQGQSCPIQDEPERGERFQHKMSLKTIWLEQGTLRVNASHHAARRTSHPRRDAGVPLRQQLAQFRRSWPRPDLRPSRTRLAHPKIPRLDQEGERHRAPLSRQNQRTQRGPNHSLDRPLARPRRHPAASFTAPPVPDSLHVRRYPAAGQSRWRPRRPLRPSRAPHITARIRSPRPGRIRKLGLDLGLPHLQLAAHPDLSRKARPSHQDPLHGG